jgi:hypothetical protein
MGRGNQLRWLGKLSLNLSPTNTPETKETDAIAGEWAYVVKGNVRITDNFGISRELADKMPRKSIVIAAPQVGLSSST